MQSHNQGGYIIKKYSKYVGLDTHKDTIAVAVADYGGITKTGNAHVRRVLTEAAWCYRFPARKTVHLQRRAEKTSKQV